MTELTFERFCQMFEHMEPDDTVMVDKGKRMKFKDINLRELYDQMNKDSYFSHTGLKCGIMGCGHEPNYKCPICNASYCDNHKKWHEEQHKQGGNGMIKVDFDEAVDSVR